MAKIYIQDNNLINYQDRGINNGYPIRQ